MKSFENCDCTNQTSQKVTKIIKIGGEEVKAVDAPATVCQDCGEVYFDGLYILELEREVRQRRDKQAA